VTILTFKGIDLPDILMQIIISGENNLEGTIPSEIGLLDNVKSLYLGKHHFLRFRMNELTFC